MLRRFLGGDGGCWRCHCSYCYCFPSTFHSFRRACYLQFFPLLLLQYIYFFFYFIFIFECSASSMCVCVCSTVAAAVAADATTAARLSHFSRALNRFFCRALASVCCLRRRRRRALSYLTLVVDARSLCMEQAIAASVAFTLPIKVILRICYVRAVPSLFLLARTMCTSIYDSTVRRSTYLQGYCAYVLG